MSYLYVIENYLMFEEIHFSYFDRFSRCTHESIYYDFSFQFCTFLDQKLHVLINSSEIKVV